MFSHFILKTLGPTYRRHSHSCRTYRIVFHFINRHILYIKSFLYLIKSISNIYISILSREYLVKTLTLNTTNNRLSVWIAKIPFILCLISHFSFAIHSPNKISHSTNSHDLDIHLSIPRNLSLHLWAST